MVSRNFPTHEIETFNWSYENPNKAPGKCSIVVPTWPVLGRPTIYIDFQSLTSERNMASFHVDELDDLISALEEARDYLRQGATTYPE